MAEILTLEVVYVQGDQINIHGFEIIVDHLWKIHSKG
jgi:hypothetical protein